MLNYGESEELWFVFFVLGEVVFIGLVREFSEICVEVDECLFLLEFGDVGIEKLTLIRRDMLFVLLSLL